MAAQAWCVGYARLLLSDMHEPLTVSQRQPALDGAGAGGGAGGAGGAGGEGEGEGEGGGAGFAVCLLCGMLS